MAASSFAFAAAIRSDSRVVRVPRAARWLLLIFACLAAISLFLLAVPMCLLYELGIWAAHLFIKHTKAPDAEGNEAHERAEGHHWIFPNQDADAQPRSPGRNMQIR